MSALHPNADIPPRPVNRASLPGSAEDSVNAALGFASIFLPVTTMALLGTLSLATPALAERVGQLVASLAAIHRVSWGGAASGLSAAFVCIAFVTTNITYRESDQEQASRPYTRMSALTNSGHC
jgi:hypothetical protein